MRILAISDSHGNNYPVYRAIDMLSPDAVFFAGDGAGGVQSVADETGLPFYIVKGNCDYGSFEETQVIVLRNKTFFLTHGHKYGVKCDYQGITDAALSLHADVAVFGHTHIAYEHYDNGLYLLNPGSCSHPQSGRPSCGYIDIVGGAVATNIVYF